MELNSLQKKLLLDASGTSTTTNSLLLNNINNKRLLDASGSTSSSETLNLTGNKNSIKKKNLENTNRNFFQNILGNVSEWAVGDDADWGTYWERGLGKSNINLMMQYHTDGKKEHRRTKNKPHGVSRVAIGLFLCRGNHVPPIESTNGKLYQ